MHGSICSLFMITSIQHIHKKYVFMNKISVNHAPEQIVTSADEWQSMMHSG